jgi:hypothetical protein
MRLDAPAAVLVPGCLQAVTPSPSTAGAIDRYCGHGQRIGRTDNPKENEMLKKLMVLAIAGSVATVSFAETGTAATGAPGAEKTAAAPKAKAKHTHHAKKSTHQKAAAKTEAPAAATK